MRRVPIWNADLLRSFVLFAQVCLTNDPRPTSEYHKLYTVDYLNNMDNAGTVVYVNMPIEALKTYARVALENNEVPFWYISNVETNNYSFFA